MTAPQQPEPGKHCGHECVCMSFSYNKLQKFARPCVIDTCQHDTRQRNVPEGSDCDKCIHNVPARVRTEFRKCDITDHLIGYDSAFVKHMNAVGCRSFEVSQ